MDPQKEELKSLKAYLNSLNRGDFMKIVIPYGDTAHITCRLLMHQIGGVFEYIPKEGDKIQMLIKNKCGRVIYTHDENAVSPYDKPIQVSLDLDLHEGKYKYDLKLITDGDIYTVVHDNDLIIN